MHPILEDIDNAIAQGHAAAGKIGLFEFKIISRVIPDAPMERPKDMVLLRDSGLTKWQWRTEKAQRDAEFVRYNKIRLAWVAEKHTVQRLQRIRNYLEKLLE